ncbi:MAG: site-specific integrase [Dysgonamonadaceae bacterium]|jgi:site-specific recombinase XerD|nr:site-specific integrase [Dysgonamonadaceae bacterium]
MAHIKSYIRDSYKNRRGECPVYVGFYIKREKIELPCEFSVKPENWKDGKVLKSDKYSDERNMIITSVMGRANDILVDFRLMRKDINKKIFIEEYRKPKRFSSFYDFVSFSQKLRFQEVEDNTQRKHKSTIKILKEFSPEISFDKLTTDFLREYAVYLKKVRKNKPITINKNIKVLRSYVSEALKKEYMSIDPFEDFRLPPDSRPSIMYLTEEELIVLNEAYRDKKFEGNRHLVLEFYLFMCYSSLHISDAKNFSVENINKNSIVYYRIKNRNRKPEPITIPLSDPLRLIINKIKKRKIKGKIFDKMLSDQKINENLKVIAKELKIDKPLNAKSGRHTFATIYARKTRDLNGLKQLLGHTNIRETMIYAHVMDEDIRENMKVFNVFSVV